MELAILAAFGGGIFGAALGGLPTFIFTGLAVMAGVAAASIDPAAAAIINDVAFGTVFGPHIAFSGGAAAAAYAYKKGLIENGKDIVTPLVKLADPSLFIVGGIFGVGGYLLNNVFVGMGLPTDTIALTVVISNMLARILFGNGPFGKVPEGGSLMQTTETNVWLPWQKDLPHLIILGAGLGAISAIASLATGSPVIGFGISAFSLIFLATLGAGPVWHHMALPAGAAALASGSLLVGVVFGIIGALLGELGARLMMNYGDTHIDPPAFAIFISIAAVLLFIGPF